MKPQFRVTCPEAVIEHPSQPWRTFSAFVPRNAKRAAHLDGTLPLSLVVRKEVISG